MGSVRNTESYYDFRDLDGMNGSDMVKYWREHTELSNNDEWEKGLSKDEVFAIGSWTGGGYSSAADLYTEPWDTMPDYQKEYLSDLYNAVNKFELKKNIQVNRATDFQIFGANEGTKMSVDQVKDYLKNNTDGGLIQNDGFMSFSTRANGVSVDGIGLVIHLKVPKNKGLGAYVSGVGGNFGEKEYMLNNNSIIKFDQKSVQLKADGKVHVNGRLMGQAKMQTIDPKNDSKFSKKKK